MQTKTITIISDTQCTISTQVLYATRVLQSAACAHAQGPAEGLRQALGIYELHTFNDDVAVPQI